MNLRTLIQELRLLEANRREFSDAEARAIGTRIGVNWRQIDLEQFRIGLAVELEHGGIDAETNVTDDDLDMTGKIAWAHLKEVPDYYTKLAVVEPDIKSLRASLAVGRTVYDTNPSAAPGWTRKG